MSASKTKPLKKYDAMFTYYHREETSNQSQIKVICEGMGYYVDFFSKEQMIVSSKKEKTKRNLLLKKELTFEKSQNFII